ncbi:MAG: hypothetical protein JF589_09095 [Gemmatimonadetes bacterium]|nr:hypothetical protein [Gemmatimonadota bacterium]
MMRRLVDYAGLFPPAELSMSDATARYASYLRSPDAWMLGRFVVPLEHLDELAACAEPLLHDGGDAWRISALVGKEANAGVRIRTCNSEHRGRLMVDVVECRPIARGSIASTIGPLPGEMRIFVELPLIDDPRAGLVEIRGAGAWAKIRTGGVTPDAFPSAREIARFLSRAAELIVPFKATAGLHHPVCGTYPLTYAESPPRARMFGFLNVFAAAVFAQARMPERLLTELVDEEHADALRFSDEVLSWREHTATTAQIARARASLGLSFGSCSFEEPVAGLRELGLL